MKKFTSAKPLAALWLATCMLGYSSATLACTPPPKNDPQYTVKDKSAWFTSGPTYSRGQPIVTLSEKPYN
ncbi:MAG: hypothetical protein ACRCV6_01870 [Formosimonas sp.]